jgi:hypothetical protein
VGELGIHVHCRDVEGPLLGPDAVRELEAVGYFDRNLLLSLAFDRGLRHLLGVAGLGFRDLNLLALVFHLLRG